MKDLPPGSRIIVIGASAGGFEAIKTLTADLPPDFPHAIFIVWHMAPDSEGLLPAVINRLHTIPAAEAVDRQPIKAGHIYIAPPDRHLLIEKDCVRVTHGPKENRFRPAVDPLFRSAAQVYGSLVIGIVLSGALDDGTAGLWAIKRRGGLAIIQEPADAMVSSMPESALEAVDIDYQVPVAEMGALLVSLCSGSFSPRLRNAHKTEKAEDDKIRLEVKVALDELIPDENLLGLGKLSPYACPECHGVLIDIKENGRSRFRCHTGHAFSATSLLSSLNQQMESDLWRAVRGMQEAVFLLNNLGDHLSASNEPKPAALYFNRAKQEERRSELIKYLIGHTETLNEENIGEQVKNIFEKKRDDQLMEIKQ